MKKKGILPGPKKKRHYRRTVIIAEIVTGEFYHKSLQILFGMTLKNSCKLSRPNISWVCNFVENHLQLNISFKTTVDCQ